VRVAGEEGRGRVQYALGECRGRLGYGVGGERACERPERRLVRSAAHAAADV
jgi:hypothetical protein